MIAIFLFRLLGKGGMIFFRGSEQYPATNTNLMDGIFSKFLFCGFNDPKIYKRVYITRDGEIHRGRSLEEVGAHCRNHNAHSIGACYEGGLDADGKPKDTRTLEQKGALLALLRELRRQFPKALIVGHHDLNPMKGCPCFDAVKEYGQV